jgi:hypothetical protein
MAVQEDQVTQKPKTLRVRVVDKSRAGEPVVNVRMPIGIVKFAMKMAKAHAPRSTDDVDWDEISAAIEAGRLGKIVDVDDEAEHKTVEVWIE